MNIISVLWKKLKEIYKEEKIKNQLRGLKEKAERGNAEESDIETFARLKGKLYDLDGSNKRRLEKLNRERRRKKKENGKKG